MTERWEEILAEYLEIRDEGASAEERRMSPSIFIADACQRIAELEGADELLYVVRAHITKIERALAVVDGGGGKRCLAADARERIKALEAELREAGEATGFAGVDVPMTVAECVTALRKERDESRTIITNILKQVGGGWEPKDLPKVFGDMAHDRQMPVNAVVE